MQGIYRIWTISTIIKTFGMEALCCHHKIMRSRVWLRLERDDMTRFSRDNLTDGENVDAAESLLQREGYRAGRKKDRIYARYYCSTFPSLSYTLSAMVPLVTTSRTFVRLSKSRGKLTNLGPDARCICILRRVIPRLVIGDSIAERSVRL